MASPSSAAEAVARVAESARVANDHGLHRLDFRAMSTPCQVKVHGVAASVAQEFQRDVVNWVGQFEARYSRFIPDSLISKINTAAGEHWIETDTETDRLFNLCQELFFFTRGSFDPTALPLIKLWNWKQQPPVVPTADAIRATRELVGWNKIQRRKGGIFLPQHGMALDLGGIGKEYAVDCVMNLATERGIQNVLVDFGQDVRARGHAPEKNSGGSASTTRRTPANAGRASPSPITPSPITPSRPPAIISATLLSTACATATSSTRAPVIPR